MKKILTALIFAFMIIALFSGCSDTENYYADAHIQSSDDSTENDYEIEAAPLSSMPTFSASIDDFHDYLLDVRAYASGGNLSSGMNTEEEIEMQTAVSDWNLGDIEHYYIPSWLPEGFTLGSIGVTNWSVGYTYATDELISRRNSEDREYVLSNQIVFSWIKEFKYTIEEFIINIVERHGLEPVDGIEGLYYVDYGASDHVNIVRSFWWVQDGYVFMLDVPLRTITDMPGGIGEIAANTLVMNSALEVELVDGVYYEPPTNIDLDQPAADIPVGETLTLTADVSPDNATIDAVIWSSSDNSVATVSQSGVVTRVGAGAATITARTLANGLTVTFEVVGTEVLP